MIDLLKVAATHLEVKQKSLLDELVQNRETLDRLPVNRKMLNSRSCGRQKTFVLSRNSLALLDDISNKYNLSRDCLVELCISRLIPLIEAEREKHEQRRQLIKDVEQYLSRGKTLLKKAESILEPNDRFRSKLEEIVTYTERNVKELKNFFKEKKSLNILTALFH